MTSSKTVLPVEGESGFAPAPSPGGISVLASSALVCCRIEMRVFSGIPGMSFSAIAFKSAE